MKVPLSFFGVLWFILMAYLQLNIYWSAQYLCFYTIYWASYPSREDLSLESQYLVPLVLPFKLVQKNCTKLQNCLCYTHGPTKRVRGPGEASPHNHCSGYCSDWYWSVASKYSPPYIDSMFVFCATALFVFVCVQIMIKPTVRVYKFYKFWKKKILKIFSTKFLQEHNFISCQKILIKLNFYRFSCQNELFWRGHFKK